MKTNLFALRIILLAVLIVFPFSLGQTSKEVNLKNKIEQVQKYLKQNNIPAWLLYDFRGINPIAVEFLGIKGLKTRRWYYLIKAEGEPVALVHKIEEQGFKDIPGKIIPYVSWEEQREKLKQLLSVHLFSGFVPYPRISCISAQDHCYAAEHH